eukprot:gene7553-10292_t
MALNFFFVRDCFKTGGSKSIIHRMEIFVLKNSNNNKEQQREEQYRIQQEILARRKSKSKMQEYFNKVDEKRMQATKDATKNLWARSDDKDDPLSKWKNEKSKGNIKPLGYESEPDRKDSKLGLNIVIPINPIGIPKYDNGERFDLRLPYAERGYEDPEADVIGNFFKSVSGLFKSSKNDKDTVNENKK